VTVAGAERIGHGVAIGYEDSAFQTLRIMADRDTAVEVCLTSNDLILGVKGRDHPVVVEVNSASFRTQATDRRSRLQPDATPPAKASTSGRVASLTAGRAFAARSFPEIAPGLTWSPVRPGSAAPKSRRDLADHPAGVG